MNTYDTEKDLDAWFHERELMKDVGYISTYVGRHMGKDILWITVPIIWFSKIHYWGLFCFSDKWYGWTTGEEKYLEELTKVQQSDMFDPEWVLKIVQAEKKPERYRAQFVQHCNPIREDQYAWEEKWVPANRAKNRSTTEFIRQSFLSVRALYFKEVIIDEFLSIR